MAQEIRSVPIPPVKKKQEISPEEELRQLLLERDRLELEQLQAQRDQITRGMGRDSQFDIIPPSRPVTGGPKGQLSPEAREELKREVLPLGGAVAGGIAGGPLGAMLGGAAGEAGAQILEQTGRLDTPPPVTTEEALGRIGLSGLLFGAGGLGERAALGTAERLGARIPGPLAKKISPAEREALGTIGEVETATGLQIPVTPAPFTESRAVDVAQNFAQASFFGGQRFIEAAQKTKEVFGKFTDDLIERLQAGIGDEQFGTLFRETVAGENGFEQLWRSVGRGQYQALDQLIQQKVRDSGNALISPNIVNLDAFAVAIQRQIEQIGGKEELKGLLSTLNDIVKKFGTDPVLGSTRASFMKAQEIRSDLIRTVRLANEDNARASAVKKQLVNVMDSAMENAAKRVGIEQEWRAANKFWKEGVDSFQNEFIRKVLDKQDMSIFRQIIPAGGELNPEKLTPLIKSITNPVTKKVDQTLLNKLQGDFLQEVIRKSTTDDFTNPAKILTQLKRFGGPKGENIKILFPEGRHKILEKAAKAENIALSKQPDSTGRFAVQIGQIGAIRKVLGAAAGVAAGGGFLAGAPGAGLTGAAFILLAPEAVAKAFTSRRFVNFLLKGGVKPGPVTKGTILTAGKVAAELAKLKIEHELIDPANVDISQNLKGKNRVNEQALNRFSLQNLINADRSNNLADVLSNLGR